MRFDYFHGNVPAQDQATLLAGANLPPPTFVPVASYAPVPDVPLWKDVSPRLGVAYDLFGNGKTAIKANLGRYVAGQSVAIANANNPVFTTLTSVSRTFTDTTATSFQTAIFCCRQPTASAGQLPIRISAKAIRRPTNMRTMSSTGLAIASTAGK